MHKTAITGLCILVSTAGFILGRATADETRSPLPLAVADSGTAPALLELRSELIELKKSLVELELRLQSRTNVDTAAPSGGRFENADKELQELIARFSASADGAATGSLNLNSESTGYASREAFESAMATVQARIHAGDDESFQGDYEAAVLSLNQRHRLWSLQQLLARYGPPDKLNPDKNWLSLQYNLTPEPGLERGFVRFRVREGLVVETDWEIGR